MPDQVRHDGGEVLLPCDSWVRHAEDAAFGARCLSETTAIPAGPDDHAFLIDEPFRHLRRAGASFAFSPPGRRSRQRDEGARVEICGEGSPSSDPSGHLLPSGEKKQAARSRLILFLCLQCPRLNPTVPAAPDKPENPHKPDRAHDPRPAAAVRRDRRRPRPVPPAPQAPCRARCRACSRP